MSVSHHHHHHRHRETLTLCQYSILQYTATWIVHIESYTHEGFWKTMWCWNGMSLLGKREKSSIPSFSSSFRHHNNIIKETEGSIGETPASAFIVDPVNLLLG